MTQPHETFLPRVRASQDALVTDLSRFRADDAWARKDSLLPGWSRGHVLTHLARQADAVSTMLERALAGELVAQYPGGEEQRSGDIERGAHRPVEVLLDDVATASRRLVTAAEAFPADRWDDDLLFRSGPRPAYQALVARWREVEIHRVDLGYGYRPEDWPEEFVAFVLPLELDRLPQRAPGVAVPEGHGDAAVLAWLLGRSDDPALPELPPWL
ncbi:maleylpyruvate isomerase N-terminal domain-containing protein [Thermobifida halotolerans]|uniref:Maleylpyruvate isomerase N-terminal domain-containing protein n=1 Tax=Thermobifida halotolerans TaxID=483545 RepID=A0AA97M382_9ACTN|nr:maleylpyruvate isomerase N-terminal domain-containing protein [Thermobifida halotolerans]UOE18701.1 maleylpyruvate isomerase N-terminal domain-containing protein [Thermobifida halotolerans]